MFSNSPPIPAAAPQPMGRWAQHLLTGLHHTFAMIGAIVLALALLWISAPQLRLMGMQHWAHWFQSQKLSVLGIPAQIALPSVFDSEKIAPQEDQAAVTDWLSRKYKVAPKILGPLVNTAYAHAAELELAPTLILAVIAVESRFNPFAKNPAGAQGLMQISTDKYAQIYELFGGKTAALDPNTNIRIGTRLLKVKIDSAQGSVAEALKDYASTNEEQLDAYVEKVLMEQARLQWVSQGKRVPFAFRPQGMEIAQWSSTPPSGTGDPWKKL